MARKSSEPTTQERRARPSRRGVPRQPVSNARLATVLSLSSIFLLTMMVLAVQGEHGMLSMWRQQRDVAALVREIEAMEQENARLRQEIQRLQHDTPYIEKIAREELGFVRPGELVFEFVE